jgi:cytochrome c
MPFELPLPLPLSVLKVALVIAFLLHIVFVNLMVGGTLLTLHAHWLSRKDPAFVKFAHQLLGTVTVHKSMAVVLGVGPLLLISLAYTVPFYTASVLLAPAWLSVLWLVTLAFGLLYAYKYTWHTWRLSRPRWHAAFGIGGGLCFLVIPFIYLTVTNLMLDPSAWPKQPNFFTALFTVGNVFPRYVHFMLASVAIAGFWVALWWGRERVEMEPAMRAKVIRLGTLWALIPTCCQFVAGPVVLFTLAPGAVSPLMVGLLAVGILAGALSIFSMIDSLRGASRMKRAALLLLVTVCCMGTVRHLIRESLLSRAASPLSCLLPCVIVNVTIYEDGRLGHDKQTTTQSGSAAQALGGGAFQRA